MRAKFPSPQRQPFPPFFNLVLEDTVRDYSTRFIELTTCSFAKNGRCLIAKLVMTKAKSRGSHAQLVAAPKNKRSTDYLLGEHICPSTISRERLFNDSIVNGKNRACSIREVVCPG